MKKERNSFIFYRSFYEAIKLLPAEEQLKIYEAIAEFSLNEKNIELNNIQKSIFILIKPQLEANRKRFINGCKNKKSKTEAKRKQNGSKTEANVNVNVNENLNEKKNIKKKKNYGEFGNVKLSEDEYEKLIQIYRGNHDLLKAIQILGAYIEAKGKRYKSHYAVLGKTQWVYREVYKNETGRPKSQMQKNREIMLKEIGA
jgi:hypothetical protein